MAIVAAWGVPVPFWEELRRRNVVRVGIAYLVVAWLVIQAADTLFPLLQLPEWTVRLVIGLLILGFPLALILSWAYELTPEGLKKSSDVDPAESVVHSTGRKLDRLIIVVLALAVVFLVLGDFLPDEPTAPIADAQTETTEIAAEAVPPAAVPLPDSIAVLPFANLSPEEENAFFAIGLHDEILNQLSKLSNLSVISRTSMMRYAQSDLSVPEIARELNVETVMEGTVRYAGDQIRVTVQLIDAATDQHMWSETYQEQFDDVFAIESDIAMNVANALNAEFSAEEQAAIERTPTESPEVYALFLRLRALAVTGGSINEQLELLDRVLAIDPDYAEVIGFSATLKGSLFVNTAQGTGIATENQAALEREIRELAARALELDPGNPYALRALRGINLPTWRWSEFEAALRPQDEPFMTSAQQWVFAWMGRPAEAVRLGEKIAALNPGQGGPLLTLGVSQSYAGDYLTADRTMRRAAELLPLFPLLRVWIGYNQIALGNEPAALDALQLTENLLGNEPPLVFLPELAYSYSRIGRNEDAERLFAAMQSIENENALGAGAWAMAYLAIGDEETALEQLEIVAEKARNHVPDQGYLNAMNLRMNFLNDPRLERPEFADVLGRIRGD